jgi:hypothetical protein
MIVGLTDLRINNQAATATVRITDPFPTISWTYSPITRVVTSDPPGEIASTQTAAQFSFEIRISDSNAALGTDSFIGHNAEVTVLFDGTSWRFRGTDLNRGELYYGQIRVTDVLGNVGDWQTFTFQYNALPSVSGVTITPASPTAHDTLSLSYTFVDPDGDLERNSLIWWYRNGVHDRRFDGYTSIDSKYLVYGDTWSVQVIAGDGYEHGGTASSSTVTVTTTAPVAAGLSISPENPTYDDPLYAVYDITSATGDDESTVEWYVNGVQQATGRFARLNVVEGDVVHFEITPSDGVSEGTYLVSPSVTIAAPKFRVLDLRVQNRVCPKNLRSLTPTISWDVGGPGGTPTLLSVHIGTVPFSDNIASYSLETSTPSFTIPDGVLEAGRDYFVSVAIGDEKGLGDYAVTDFRIFGSKWHDAVSNSTGWTIETVFRVDGGLSGIEYGEIADYHGIRIHDGTKSAEIRFFVDKIALVSGGTKQTLGDFTESSVITITGQGSNIKIFQNYKLILDGSGLFTAATTEKSIEFGSLQGSMDGWYQHLYYSVEGAYEPNVSLRYAELGFEPFYDSTGHINYVTNANGTLYFSSCTTGDASRVFQVKDNESQSKATAASRAFIKFYNIVNTGKHTYICHSSGATAMVNYPVVNYDNVLNLAGGDDPVDGGWKLFSNDASVASFGGSGLTIDTRYSDSQYFFAQNTQGTPWFDRVRNDKGWTVGFSLKVDAVTDDNSAQNTDPPDGVGVYVNDGVYYENVYFFPTQIVFGASGKVIAFDTTATHEYLLVGKENSIELYADKTLIGSDKLSLMATAEGNGGRPCVCEDASGKLHAVWHDDGPGYRQLYYASGTAVTDVQSTVRWTFPRLIASSPYGAGQPAVAVDTHGTVYVVFETERGDYTDVGLVVKNNAGWSDPFRLAGGQYGSYNPRVAVDDLDNVHVVWEDWQSGVPQIYYMSRDFLDGKWSSPAKLTTNQYGCTRPSLDVYGTDVYVSYTGKKASGFTEIFLTAKLSGTWQSPKSVFTSGRDSDYSDIVVDPSYVYVVWHDSGDGDYEIYARRFNLSLVAVEAAKQLTNNNNSSRFPSIGICQNTGNAYVVWEDGGELSPYTSLGNYTFTVPNIRSGYFNQGTALWVSSNQSGGHDIAIIPPDNRASRRPRIAKHYATNAHVVYESEPSNFAFEYIPTTDGFVVIADAVYDGTDTASYNLNTLKDLRLSGRLFRKEIRFGDFSQTLGGKYTFGYLRYYLGAAVGPYNAALVSGATTSLATDACFDAVVNENGDAWLANDEGLFFFFRDSKEIGRLPTSNDFSGKSVNCVAVDLNHVLFVGTDTSLYVSYDHINFSAVTFPEGTSITHYRHLAFDPHNRLWAATDDGLYVLRTDKFSTGDVAISTSHDVTLVSSLPTTKVVVDSGGTAWAASSSGLIASHNNSTTVYNVDNSSIGSNQINDIAIRHRGLRYVATANGLLRMTSDFQRVGVDNPLWTNNVIAVAWQEPNVLWAASGVNVFEILVDDEIGSVSSLAFTPYDYALLSPSDCDEPRIYRFQGFNSGRLMEVYVNGKKLHYGYIFSEEEGAVVFDAPLKQTDVVEIYIRNDIAPFADLAQNKAERLAYGKVVRSVKKFLTDGAVVYAAVTGDKEQLLSLDTTDNFNRPYDKIGVDTTPPTGTLSLIRQITRRNVELGITADDNLSGVDQMAISTFSNLTSDGSTPLPYEPFSASKIQDLGTDLSNASDQITFSGTDGRRLVSFNGTKYAGTAGPARIYEYNLTTKAWTLKATLDADSSDASVEFLIVYKNALIIGTGSDSGTGKIYVSSDGSNFTLLSTITGTHAKCAAVLQGMLFIGTSGSGYLYSYNGKSLTTVRTANTEGAAPVQMGTSVDSLWGEGARVYAGTSPQARLYRFDPLTLTNEIIYVAPGTTETPESSITAISSLTLDRQVGDDTVQDVYVFAGTETFGRIVKSVNGGAFVTSFAGLPATVTAAHIFNDDLWVAVGKTLYKWNKTWVARYSHSEQIEDFIVGSNISTGDDTEPRNDITIISASKITQVNGQIAEKSLYLSLKDVAGNVSETIKLALSIDDLDNFINTKRVLELDEYGKTVFTYDGDAAFYAADKVIQEQGVYYSEIFSGTNDHVSWDKISWDVDLPDDTDITISVRTSDFRATLPLEEFAKTFTKDDASGADISNLSGKYIQFKAVLSTTVRGKTPKLYKVVISSRTRAAVHFFTTNFNLPSRLSGGIVTARTFLPVAADIVFGINTHDSVDFSDYQVVEPDRLFFADPEQNGLDFRVGIKLISPLPQSLTTDFIDEYDSYDPYMSPLYTNVIDFSYSNGTGASQTFDFKIELYNDHGMTDLQTTLYTGTDVAPWNVNGDAFPSGGLEMAAGETVSLLAAVKGMASVRCGVDYYVKIFATHDGSTFELVSQNHAFLANCHPNFVDDIFFDFTNTSSVGNFHFRCRVFSDPARTVMVKNFYSGLDQSGWTVNGGSIGSGGVHITSGTTVSVGFTPDLSDLDSRKTYYLIVDYISAGDFINISNSYTMRFTEITDFDCSEYMDVPVVKDVGILVDLEEYEDEFGKKRRTFLFKV